MQPPDPPFAAVRGRRPRRPVAAISVPALAGEELSTVLDRVGAELAGLRAAVLDLQQALGPTLTRAAGDREVLRAGQGLDLVAQTLDGLSTFLVALHRGRRRSGRLDAARAASLVGLGGLSARLAGQEPAMTGDEGRGDFELF